MNRASVNYDFLYSCVTDTNLIRLIYDFTAMTFSMKLAVSVKNLHFSENA